MGNEEIELYAVSGATIQERSYRTYICNEVFQNTNGIISCALDIDDDNIPKNMLPIPTDEEDINPVLHTMPTKQNDYLFICGRIGHDELQRLIEIVKPKFIITQGSDTIISFNTPELKKTMDMNKNIKFINIDSDMCPEFDSNTWNQILDLYPKILRDLYYKKPAEFFSSRNVSLLRHIKKRDIDDQLLLFNDAFSRNSLNGAPISFDFEEKISKEMIEKGYTEFSAITDIINKIRKELKENNKLTPENEPIFSNIDEAKETFKKIWDLYSTFSFDDNKNKILTQILSKNFDLCKEYDAFAFLSGFLMNGDIEAAKKIHQKIIFDILRGNDSDELKSLRKNNKKHSPIILHDLTMDIRSDDFLAILLCLAIYNIDEWKISIQNFNNE